MMQAFCVYNLYIQKVCVYVIETQYYSVKQEGSRREKVRQIELGLICEQIQKELCLKNLLIESLSIIPSNVFSTLHRPE